MQSTPHRKKQQYNGRSYEPKAWPGAGRDTAPLKCPAGRKSSVSVDPKGGGQASTPNCAHARTRERLTCAHGFTGLQSRSCLLQQRYYVNEDLLDVIDFFFFSFLC